jgi:hypothetical protein
LCIYACDVSVKFANDLAKAKAYTPSGPDLIFFYSFAPSDISDRVRRICDLQPAKSSTSPIMIILDIPDSGAFYKSTASEVTEATIGEFINAFQSKSLPRLQLKR